MSGDLVSNTKRLSAVLARVVPDDVQIITDLLAALEAAETQAESWKAAKIASDQSWMESEARAVAAEGRAATAEAALEREHRDGLTHLNEAWIYARHYERIIKNIRNLVENAVQVTLHTENETLLVPFVATDQLIAVLGDPEIR